MPLVVPMLKCCVFVRLRLGLPGARSAGRLEMDLELEFDLLMDLLVGGGLDLKKFFKSSILTFFAGFGVDDFTEAGSTVRLSPPLNPAEGIGNFDVLGSGPGGRSG